jgi:hypothetical protein
MHDLRERALVAPPVEIGLGSEFDFGGVWLVLMETGHREAAVSLVCIADGATSLYFSNGGGIIGAGEHASVRNAALEFIAMTNRSRALLAVVANHPLPAFDRVRFYARAGDALLGAEESVSTLGSGGHTLSPLFAAAHAVIAAIRETGAVP